jgi:protein AbiQ
MKQTRPYVLVHITLGGLDYAIPLRSNIKHNEHVLWTDKENRCGLDFTKAVVIEDEAYIDAINKPFIRPHEHKALLGQEYNIQQGMLRYIETYKKAKTQQHIPRNKLLCSFSTMQYFEQYL